MLVWIVLGLSVFALSSSAACLWTSCRLNAAVEEDREETCELRRQVNDELAILDRRHARMEHLKSQIIGHAAPVPDLWPELTPVIGLHRPEANGSA